MPRINTPSRATIFLLAAIALLSAVFYYSSFESNSEEGEYDGPEEAIRQELEMTRDPLTGRVPWSKLIEAKLATETAKVTARQNRLTALSWEERGPNADVVGPSNGNSRANGGITAGRVRALMVDSLDPTKKTVFAGSVSGGLWKTTDITASPAVWVNIGDFFSNLAISGICQDPRSGFQNIMYLCTGESYYNADAAQGVGVFKSTDGGATWSYLSSSSAYTFCTRILCDYLGNVYLATRNGLYRSTDGGSSWANITPSGVPSVRICDLEISSTSGPGRLHMVTGISSAQSYRYTDIPATVTAATGWNIPTTAFPSFTARAEIAVNGNVLYALPCNNSGQVTQIFKSTDGGDNWNATAGTPPNTASGSPFANTQGWYDLSVRINPANVNECIIGAIDCARTLDGGDTWQRISAWVGTAGQYVHADQHELQWWDGGTKLIFGCDGGVHYSSDKGTTIRDRNTGLRVKQFYSVAIHPTQTNYFLAGAQDNGVHQLNSAGLGNSVEVTGGDGAFVAIDQNEPTFQFGSYVYNVYRRSTNNGANWSSFSLNSSSGRFINPWEYDNQANIIYACSGAGNYLRWDDPQTAASAGSATTAIITVPEFAGQTPSAIFASPYTANRVYFGMGAGKVIRVDNANTATPAAVDITPAGAPAGYVSCVVTGSSDNTLMAVYSNYGVQNIWVSTNGGTSWTNLDDAGGTNLPNMPVRWALFHPDTDTKAFIATETGVWETDLINGAATVWNATPSFPNVRVTMLKYRSSDRTIVASTYGRGVWTATVPAPSGFSFTTPAAATASCPAPQNMTLSLGTSSSGGFTNPITLSATGNPAGTTVSFTTNPLIPGSSTIVILNGTNNLVPGTYQVTVQGTATGAVQQTRQLSFIITSGTAPVISTQPQDQSICAGSNTSFTTIATGATYQWQVSTNGGSTYTDITGATSSVYAITNAPTTLSGNLYRCVVSNSCGNTATSVTATLTVSGATSIVTPPQDATLCVGGSNTFRVTAAGASLAYQWQVSTDGGTNYSNISGATASQYTLSGITLSMSGNRYRCVVTGTCAPGTATSAAATLTVVTALSITQQPVAQTVCAGTDAVFNVTAIGASSFQWQVSTDGGTTFTAISGATNSSLTITAALLSQSGNQYRCVVGGSCGSATTTVAALLVNPVTALTSQPVAQTVCAGSAVGFSVTATGSGITYQWQQSTNGCNGPWTNISGATAATYSIANATLSLHNTAYRCIVNGTCTLALTSGCGLLSVIAPVTVITQPLAQVVCDGAPASFTTSGSGTGVLYQWQINTGSGFTNITNGGVYSGATTATLAISATNPAMSGYQYRCLLSNATCTSPATSDAVVLTVNTLPAITTMPVSQTICTGSNVAFSVAALGTGITYQWQVNTGSGFANIANGGIYSGVTTATLLLTGAGVSISGSQYRCIVTGTCSPAATSATATLTVHAPVVITASAPAVEICAGGTASFTVSATSIPAISYQWQVSTDAGASWSNIAGANSANYTMTGVIAAMNGNRYRCLAWNSTCTAPVASAASLLTVRVVPGIGLTAAPYTTLLPGQQTLLTTTPTSSTGGVITTNWTYNNQPATPVGNTLSVNVNGLGDYQASIRETWPSGLFCSALSPVVSITANISDRLFIFPSPNDGNFTVSYYYSGAGSSQRQLAIFDAKGARVWMKSFAIAGSYTLLPVDLRTAARGIYFVVVGDAAGNKLIEGKVHIR